MLVVFLTILFVGFQDVSAAPGTELPNKDVLLQTLREHYFRAHVDLDQYYRKDTYPGREQGHLESVVQMHGCYCKAYTRDHLGVERLNVMSPTKFFSLIKVPYEEVWKLSFEQEVDEESCQKRRRGWKNHAWMFDFGNVDWGLTDLMANRPNAKLTKVTAERFQDKPVYRFHFTRATRTVGESIDRVIHVEMDVDPALVWTIIRTVVTYQGRSDYRQELLFEYEGKVHGVPALKRTRVIASMLQPDGPMKVIAEHVTDIQLKEQPTYVAVEYTLGHYGLGSSDTWVYSLIAAGAVIILGGLIGVVRSRKRRGAAAAG
jgi:hypothetical protein